MSVHHLNRIHVQIVLKGQKILQIIYKILCYLNINYINLSLKEVLFHKIYLKCQLLVLMFKI